MENKKRRADRLGCEECPPCYSLVQDAVNQHRKELKELDDVSLQFCYFNANPLAYVYLYRLGAFIENTAQFL